MANPTTNYSFQMPTASDLVTDLPADFETFGQAVDTRLKALQPGTTLGDLAYSSATADTNTRLPIGTTGQVLAVSGGVPAWTTPAGAGLSPYVSAYRSTSLNLTNASYVELVFNAESFDSDGCYNTTNGRFTPTTAGKYFVSTNLVYDAGGIDRWHAGYNDIRKNGSSVSSVNFDGYDNYTMYTVTVSNSAIVECNGTTDYISTFYYSQVATGTMQMLSKSSMTIFKVG